MEAFDTLLEEVKRGELFHSTFAMHEARHNVEFHSVSDLTSNSRARDASRGCLPFEKPVESDVLGLPDT